MNTQCFKMFYCKNIQDSQWRTKTNLSHFHDPHSSTLGKKYYFSLFHKPNVCLYSASQLESSVNLPLSDVTKGSDASTSCQVLAPPSDAFGFYLDPLSNKQWLPQSMTTGERGCCKHRANRRLH